MNWDRVSNDVAYRHIRESTTRLLHDHLDAKDVTVRACPDWTVRDLAFHLGQVCAGALKKLKGQEPAVESGPERTAPMTELIAHWTRTGDELDRVVADGAPSPPDLMMADAFIHELDIRATLGVPPPEDHPAYPSALDVGIRGFSASLGTHRLPAVRIETSGERWVAGDGEPAATLSVSHRHDLVRSLAGRRTHEQIRRLSWSTDARRWLPAFTWGVFTPPAEPTEEPIG